MLIDVTPTRSTTAVDLHQQEYDKGMIVQMI